jgi:hypothetical protein
MADEVCLSWKAVLMIPRRRRLQLQPATVGSGDARSGVVAPSWRRNILQLGLLSGSCQGQLGDNIEGWRT